jgi:uncharacterized glyoxalase superfamily protein PhnB
VAEVPILAQLNLVVRDMEAALAFYRRLGWSFRTPTADHAAAELPNGVRVELDSVAFAATWDAGYHGGTGSSAVVGVATSSREEVDRRYADLVAHGGRPHQPPYDAFWGARYAIVDDPDGHPVGLMSPTEESRRYWPPCEPPPP